MRAAGWGWRHGGRAAWAVRDLDLTIDPGERVLLLGASGAGKSTLLAGIAGILSGQDSGESAGTLDVDGVPAHQARHRSGLLLQDPDSQLVLPRAGDEVAFGPENYAVAPDEIWRRVDEALSTVGFPYGRDRLTQALSGGEKQRLALAGVLAVRPGLLLLDEPTANLDPAGGALVRAAVVRALEATGATLVLVEHRVAEWRPTVGRVVVLAADGGLLADGAPDAVFTAYGASLRRAGVWVPGDPPSRPVEARGAGPELVRARAVSYTYRGAPAPSLHAADLTVAQGEAVAVVGANGSGKSTLATLVAGLAKPTSGRVVGSDDPAPLHARRARSLARLVGTVFQEPEHQFLARTVRDELLFAPRRLGWDDARSAARADELLERLRLTRLARANPFTLSGGEKRRLSVATALSAAPPLLVLDEPTFGQDAATWRELLGLLAAVRDEGSGLFLVSHDAEFVAALAGRTLTMADGFLCALGGFCTAGTELRQNWRVGR